MKLAYAGGHTMPIDWNAIPSWVPSTIISAVAWIMMSWRKAGVTEAEMKFRMDALREEFKAEKASTAKADVQTNEEVEELRGEMRASMAEFRAAALQIARLSSSQEVVNSITAKTLESLVTKYEALTHAVNENAASIRILSELLSRVSIQQGEKSL